MRTALLLERFDTRRGGAEVYAARLAEALLVAGHRVEVFCREAGAGVSGVEVHEIGSGGWTRGGRIRGFARACEEAVRGEGFDAVMGVGRTLGQDVLMPPGGMVRGAREGTLRSLTNPVEILAKKAGWRVGGAARATAAIERKQFDAKGRTHYVINSKMVLADLERDYEIDEKRVHLMYTGVDTRRFSPETRGAAREAARKRLGLGEETAFLFAGHNFRLKGLETLLAASARLVEQGEGKFRVLVAGGGAGKRKGFEKLERALGLGKRVTFLGAVEEMLPMYGAADAVVHPTFYDPLANVTLEAWACGLPTITSEWNGAAELMTGELEHWVVEDPTDGETLSARMKELMELMDGERREAVGKRFRETAERHDMRGHCAEVVKLFEQVLAEKERG